MRLCMVCRERKAEVPDRNRPGRPIKRICRVCHAGRLVDDIQEALRQHVKDHRSP